MIKGSFDVCLFGHLFQNFISELREKELFGCRSFRNAC